MENIWQVDSSYARHLEWQDAHEGHGEVGMKLLLPYYSRDGTGMVNFELVHMVLVAQG